MAAPGFRKPPIIIEPQIIEIHKLKPKRNRPGFELALMAPSNVSCRCGATYERTEFHSAPRKLNRFDSHACGHTLEIFSDVILATSSGARANASASRSADYLPPAINLTNQPCGQMHRKNCTIAVLSRRLSK